VWATGRRESDRPAVRYEGPALDARTEYHWTGRVWDKDGEPSGWSDPTTFETGRHEDDWEAAKQAVVDGSCDLILISPERLANEGFRARVFDLMVSTSVAPGANDDASGVAGAIEAARVLSQHEFESSIVYVGFTGEEQGLFGSTHAAEVAEDEEWTLAGVLNNDMIGNIHGINNSDLLNAPRWPDVASLIRAQLAGRTVVMYNAPFDTRLIQQTCIRNRMPPFNLHAHCAMREYAKFYGQWDEGREKFKWQSLTKAAAQQGVTIEGQAHRALSDCRTTLGVIQAMAAHLPEAA
jgi:hypothetical protein